MDKKRKIQAVSKRLTFAEAEDADDLYWSDKTPEERLLALIDLRMTFFVIQKKDTRIKKIMVKKKLYEQED